MAELTGRMFADALQPVPRSAFWSQPDWFVWCGSITRDDRGGYWLFYSRWPRASGFDGWVTDSEICSATAASPLGPWQEQAVVLRGSGRPGGWDRDVVHNPVVIRQRQRYYLYYMGNFGDGSYWNHRNHQRIGVAWATDPAGPWQRSDDPLIDVSLGFTEQPSAPQADQLLLDNQTRVGRTAAYGVDTLMTSNPTVTETMDGRFLMIYKAVGDGPLPKGGKVICSVAVAEHPMGPFRKSGRPIMVNPLHDWSVEDPCVWVQDGRYYALVKDFQGYFTGRGPSTIALFASDDGLDWQPAAEPFVMDRTINWADGTAQPVPRLERPQVFLENGRPLVLSCAVLLDQDQVTTGNIQIPIVWTSDRPDQD